MKSKVAILILLAVCVALGVGLVTEARKHAHEKKDSDDKVALLMTDLQGARGKLEEQTQVNAKLEGDLVTHSNDLATLSNQLARSISDLEKSDAQSKATAEQLRTAQAELAKKDQKITELESQRVALGRQMEQLTNSISELEKQIAATEKKLSTTRGEKDFLVKELTRMRAEKAELERRFSDIAALRGQIGKLKEEMAIARRLEFTRLNLIGVTAKGGAEKLMAKKPEAPPGTNFDLNVEIRQGGDARVVTPTNAVPATTNTVTPAPTNAPGRFRVPLEPPK